MLDQHVQRLMVGIKLRDIAWVMQYENMLRNIYVLNDSPTGLMGAHPKEGSLPWPVVVLLGSYSRKHIFGACRVSRSLLVSRIRDFCNRLRWRSIIISPDDGTRPLVKRSVRTCNKTVMPVVSAFCKAASRFIWSRVERATRVSDPLPGFMRFALRFLKSRNLKVELSDKDGVFVLAEASVVAKLVEQHLGKVCYRAFGVGNVEPAFRGVKRALWGVARAADRISGRWASELRSLADKARESDLICPMLCTIKTHKVPIEARVIISSSLSCFNGPGECLNRLLMPHIRSMPQVCLSSDDVISKLRGLELPIRAIFLKFDVKDFYLAGAQGFLVSTVCRCFPDKDQRAFVDKALNLVLGYQFSRNRFSPDLARTTLYQVMTGSGMGMKHAGACADLVFGIVVEKELLKEADQLGILKYLRYRDDILVLLRDLSFSRLFRDRLISLASIYCQVQQESYSLVGVSFLDLFVFKSDPARCSSVMVRPYIKESARHIPLASDSMHPPAVHRSWPVAEVIRMHRRSSCSSISKAWRRAKIVRFQAFRLDPAVVQKCMAWEPSVPSEVARKVLCSLGASVVSTIRAIIPYRREFLGLPSEFARFVADWTPHLKAELGQDFKFVISWSAGGRPLKSFFKEVGGVG